MPILIKGSGSKRDPILTTGSCLSSESDFGNGHWHNVPDGYDGFSSFTVAKRNAATVPTGGTAYSSHIRTGKKACVRGSIITGSMVDASANDITVNKTLSSDGSQLTVTASYNTPSGYLQSALNVSKVDLYVVPTNQYTDYECMYAGTPNTSVPTRLKLNIPKNSFDSRSIKHMILVGTDDCPAMYLQETCMVALCVDFDADIAYETYVYGSGELYDIGHRSISGICTSNTNVTLEDGSESLTLTYNDGTYVCDGYYCMQIFQ